MLVGICFLWIATPVSAGLQVHGSLFQANVVPGSTLVHSINVTLINERSPEDILLEVGGFGTTLDGRPQLVPAGEDTSPYTARPFITLDKTTLHLEPDKPQTVTATIHVPQNVGAGGRYAIIHIHTMPKGGTVALVTAMDIPVMLTIQGMEPTSTGNITSVTYREPLGVGQPARISVIYENTGDILYGNVIGKVTLADANGALVVSGASSASQGISPSSSVQLDITIEKALVPGRYILSTSAVLPNGALLDEQEKQIEVKKLYVPPFAPVTITLSPDRTQTLENSDGSIRILFPEGAVYDPVDVTLKPVSLETVPGAPEKAALGTTVFSVDGLTGLLSKEATMTVRYNQEDLDAAGGNPTKLVLARYDRSANEWSLLQPTLDTNAGTISITTNRFSTWAVIALSEPLGGASAAAMMQDTSVVLVAGVSILILAIIMLYRRYKGGRR